MSDHASDASPATRPGTEAGTEAGTRAGPEAGTGAATEPGPRGAAPGVVARARRRRTVLILASISIGWKVVVFTLGAAIPHWFVQDGIAELPPAQRAYGEEARRTALALYDGPIERYGLVRTTRVLSVARLADSAGAADCGGLGAHVRAYTYFGIPYSEARTVCDHGVVEYRIFRRRRGG